MPRIAGRPVALLVLLLFIIPSAIPTPITLAEGEVNREVIDPYLQEVMSQANRYDELDVVIQFIDPVRVEDRYVLEREGIEILHEFHIVPAVWARATPAQLELLTGYQRTSWMEYNEELEFHMDVTTEVVNATRTWYSRVEGSLWGMGGITGEGVTVVVLDSGIDAGHPDLDYGTKTIMNLKSDTGVGPWYEIENGDTSSGHGTHVAGTVAGNGDASAGQRAGVAPGANLIGLSTGELNWIISGLGGLEWVYDHSKPGNNPHNIRVVSNSWGSGGGQYDPQDSLSQAINRLVYDNNVVVVFSGGNSGGEGDTVQSSNYGNTPAALCIAASGRDGSYITSFSSRGKWDWVDTWPDVAAPGHFIWSTAARRTQISITQKDPDANPYYLDISGTSMACPHVSGLVALLFQAAPSLRVSEVRQDAGMVLYADGVYTVKSPEEDGSYGDLAYVVEEWMGSAQDTRIHEAELIIKLSARPIPPQGNDYIGEHRMTENHVPEWSVPGTAGGRSHDFAQGYGLIDIHRAVGLALTLERIRWDDPDATVLDAYSVFEEVFERKEVVRDTDLLSTSWSGEWTRFNDQLGKPIFTHNLTKSSCPRAGRASGPASTTSWGSPSSPTTSPSTSTSPRVLTK
jgi:serine protease AprX